MPARPVKVGDVRPLDHAEARHLGDAARDEAGPRVVAEAETVGHADGDGDGVLDGAAELDTDDVVVGVHAKRVAGDRRLQRDRHGLVGGGDHRGRGHVFADFLGVVRPRERGRG